MTPEEEIRHLRSLVVLLAEHVNVEDLPSPIIEAVVVELERDESSRATQLSPERYN
jgi:hypothetical protein